MATGDMRELEVDIGEAPDGCVLCDGKAYMIASPAYSALYDVIGTRYNRSGDNPGVLFRVPDEAGSVIEL